MSEKNTNFLKGTISLSLSVVLTKVLGVAFKVPLSYILSDEGMGYFNTAYAIYGFFYILCTAGVPKSLTLLLAGHRAGSDSNVTEEEILRCSLRLFFKIGLFSSLLNIICAPVFASFVGNSKACYSIIAVAPSILFVSLGGVLRGYLTSSEKLTAIAVSQLIEGLIKLFLGLALSMIGVRIGASINVISALAILGITVGSIISFVYMLYKANFLKIGYNRRQNRFFDRKSIAGKILKNSLPIALSSSLLNLSSTLDLAIIIKRLVASGMSEAYANSIYGNYTTLAVPMFTLVISVLAPISTSFMPRLSALDIQEDKKAFSDNFNQLLNITLLISVPASLALYYYSFDLLDVLFSVNSSAIGAELLICLSMGIPLLSTLTVVNTALESKGKILTTVISLIIGAIIKIIASYSLIDTTFGIIGAPLGTVLSYFVSLTVSLIALELSGVKTRAVFKLISLYFVGLLCFYIPYNTMYSVGIFSSSFVTMAVSIAVSMAVYSLAILVVYTVATKKSDSKCTKKYINN